MPTTHDTTSHRFRDRWVNSGSSKDQEDSAIAMDGSGNFVVVWEDERDNYCMLAGHSCGYDGECGGEEDVCVLEPRIYMRGFDRFGCERFPETRIDSSSEDQRNPAIAMNQNGDFVVAWDQGGTFVDPWDVKLRGFSSGFEGDLLEHATPVVTPREPAAGDQQQAEVAMTRGDGVATGPWDVVVVWQDDTDLNGYYNIRGAAYELDTGTAPESPSLIVQWDDRVLHPEVAGQQLRPDVTIADAAGDFWVVYEDDYDNNDYYEIYAHRWDLGASATDPEFSITPVNTTSTGQQKSPKIDIDPWGAFVIVWRDDQDVPANGVYDVAMRGFNSDGSQWFPQEDVKRELHQQNWPSIAMAYPPSGAAEGFFVVTWQDDTDNNGAHQIRASGYRYVPAGTKVNVFSDLTVNSDASGDQKWAKPAMDPAGDFVVTWTDDRDGNGFWEVLARGLEWGDLEDPDSDGVVNLWDNCDADSNAPSDCDSDGGTPDEQCDADLDDIGDACDPCPYSPLTWDCDESASGFVANGGSLAAGNTEVYAPAQFLYEPDVGTQPPVDLCVVISERPPSTDVDSHLGKAVAVVEANIDSDYQPVDVILKWDDRDSDDDGLIDGIEYPEELLLASRNGGALAGAGLCEDDPGGACSDPPTHGADGCCMNEDHWTLGDAGHGAYALLALAGSGAVPASGVGSLKLGKIPESTDLALEWGASCWGADRDYGIYEGQLGDFSSHVPVQCGTGEGTQWDVTPATGSTYYLVVPLSSVDTGEPGAEQSYEGSYGVTGYGVQRSPSSSACDGRLQEIVDCP